MQATVLAPPKKKVTYLHELECGELFQYAPSTRGVAPVFMLCKRAHEARRLGAVECIVDIATGKMYERNNEEALPVIHLNQEAALKLTKID